MVVRALGVPIGMETKDQVEADRVRAQWSRALCDEEPVETVSRGHGEDEVDGDYGLTTSVTMAALTKTAGTRLNLHAGGVCDDEGRLLVVVGASGTGKTTAIRLLASRLGYLSDETVSLSLDGPPYTALPHAKPLSVITDPDEPRRKEQLSPDDLGLLPTPESATLTRLVLLRRGTPRGLSYEIHELALVPLLEGVVELIPQTSSLVEIEHPVLFVTELLRSVGGAVVLEYEEIEAHLDDLVQLLTTELDCDEPATEHKPGGEGGDHPAPGFAARAEWRDAVRVGHDVVVMRDSEVFRLDGLGAVIWWALDQPRTLDALVELAEAELGAHEDSRTLVEAALSSLTDSRLAWLGSSP